MHFKFKFYVEKPAIGPSKQFSNNYVLRWIVRVGVCVKIKLKDAVLFGFVFTITLEICFNFFHTYRYCGIARWLVDTFLWNGTYFNRYRGLSDVEYAKRYSTSRGVAIMRFFHAVLFFQNFIFAEEKFPKQYAGNVLLKYGLRFE